MQKKIALILAMLVLVVGVVPAAEIDIETGFTTIGVSDGDIIINESGGELNLVALGDRFTGKMSAGVTGLKSVQNLPKNLSGTFIDFNVGFGPTFIKTEKVSLSLMGVLGIQGGGGECHQNYYYNNSQYTFTEYDTFDAGLFYIGPELKFTVIPSSRVGFYTYFGLYYTCGSVNNNYRFADNSPYNIPSAYGSESLELKGAICRLSLGLKIRLA